MSIFRRESADPAGPADAAAPDAKSRPTRIAPGSTVKGEITGSAEVLIEGELEGEIRVEAGVVVGADGLVQGPITAQVVTVGGRVVGDVRGSERVEVAPTGSVEGNIAAPRIVIAEGAFFMGKVEMQGDTTKEAPRRRASGEQGGE